MQKAGKYVCTLLDDFGRNIGVLALKTYTTWAVVLYWRLLFGKKIYNCRKIFLFNKLTYKYPSNASAPCIHLPFLISAQLTSMVSPVSALFCRKMSEKVTLPVKTVHYQMKKGRAQRWAFWRVFEDQVFTRQIFWI